MSINDFKPETKQDNTFYGSVGTNVNVNEIRDNAKIEFNAGETHFDEISFEDLESQTKELPEIQPDLLNRINTNKMLVLGGELGGINKNELIFQLAYLIANTKKSNSQESDSDQTNPQNVDISIKVWRRSSTQQIIDLELELRNRKSPTIFIFSDIEPQDINTSLQHISEIVLSLPHWVLFTTDRSFSSWHLSEKVKESFFPTDLKLQNIYGEDILVKKFQEELNRLQKELEENYQGELSEYLESLDRRYGLISQLDTLTSIKQFVKLLGEKLKELIENRKQEENQSETKSTLESIEIDIEALIEDSKNDEKFIINLFQNILNDRPQQQLLILGISFFNGIFEDQFFAALEKVFTEAWQKRKPSLVAPDYSDLEELLYNYFDFQENDLYEGVSNSFKVVETKPYQTDIRSINILSLENRNKLFEIAWQTHRRQIINALEVLVDIVKESGSEKNYTLPEKWDLYGDPTRREKLRSAITNTFSSIGLVSVNAVHSSLLRLATDKNPEVRAVAASVIASWYKSNKKEEIFRILQSFYGTALQKENAKKSQQIIGEIEEEDNIESQDESKLKEIEKLQNQNEVDQIKDKYSEFSQYFLKQYEEVIKRYHNQDESYYISKYPDLQDYVGATVAVTIDKVIYEYYEGKNLSDSFYIWLGELSESRLNLVHYYFGYRTMFCVVPLHLKEEKMQLLLKKIAQKQRGFLDWQSSLSLNHGIARSLAHAYDYPDNRSEVKNILDSWYSEVKKNLIKRYGEEDTNNFPLLQTIVLTYGEIKYNEEPPILLNDGLKRLKEVFNLLPSEQNSKYEKYLFVRKAVIDTTYSLTEKYFDNVQSELQEIISIFQPEEQKKLVNKLTDMYLKQLAYFVIKMR